MLARLRFNPYRSAVSICSDTLEARLLAYDFSEELLEHYVDYAQKRGIKVNPKFKIPIVFYLENEDDFSSFINIFKGIIYTRHEVKYYTETMHNKDKEAAAKTYQNSRLFNYRNNISYEFLLGLDELTPAMLLEPVDNVPLALAMMKNGHTRMLMRLLRPSRKNKATNHLMLANPLSVLWYSIPSLSKN